MGRRILLRVPAEPGWQRKGLSFLPVWLVTSDRAKKTQEFSRQGLPKGRDHGRAPSHTPRRQITEPTWEYRWQDKPSAGERTLG